MPRLSPSTYECSISPNATSVGPQKNVRSPIWVGISQKGLAAYSRDGVRWSEGQGIQSKGAELCSVIHGDGQFVAVGNQISVSEDGIHWTTKVHLACNPLRAVAQSGDIWICVGENGRKMHSADRGETWSDAMTWYPGNYQAIAVGSGTFVAVGETLNGRGFINKTRDDQRWDGEHLVDTPLLDVTYGAGRFVATDATGRAHVSIDGVNWTEHVIQRGRAFHRIRYVNGVFLTSTGRGQYFWSLDGDVWFKEAGFLPRTVVYGGGQYLGCSRAGRFFSASGLDQWQQQREVAYRFISFAYGPETHILKMKFKRHHLEIRIQ